MIKKNSLAYFVLLSLEKSIEIGTPMLDFYKSPYTFAMTGYRTNLNYSTTYKTIQRLRKNGFIETYRNGNQLILKLTDKGINDLIMHKLMSQDKWDGKWRIVIFDIPEKYRKVRNTFRYQLSQWGFKQLQKSVWISKNALDKELRELAKKLNISDWVKILVATEI